ncbi:MAG: hypothetical protein HZC37_15015 [Burkholderiales bacterium]|nr:hypothetical protein [Burkholderiales bacterium]
MHASTTIDIELVDLRRRRRRRELWHDACAAVVLGAVAALVFWLVPLPASASTLPQPAAGGVSSASPGMIARQGCAGCRIPM